MSLVYLGLGSNQGDRVAALEFAVHKLAKISQRAVRTSGLYETQALLPADSLTDWNLPYLNMAIVIDYLGEPLQLLAEIQRIEAEFGRVRKQYWAPRTLDIDILFWDQVKLNLPQLIIPHLHWSERAFVLDPLKDLIPHFVPDGFSKNLLQIAHENKQHLPSIMGILNVTPDSFSDGGAHIELRQIETYLNSIEKDVTYIDVGAESTRPKAIPLTAEEEWQRLEPVLAYLQNRYQGQYCRPKISLDTYHGEVAAKAIEYPIDVINDVSGLTCPVMKEVLKSSQFAGQYVLMHSVCVPADPARIIDPNLNVIDFLKNWFLEKLVELQEMGVSRERVILDPGLGFGKNQKQSFEILRGFNQFWELGCQVLIGHSRKSFLAPLTSELPLERDFECMGISVGLAQNGVDILRVHNPKAHKRVISGLHIFNENFQFNSN